MAASVRLLASGYKQRHGSTFGQLVMALAVADLASNMWYFFPSWIIHRSWFIRPAVEWCWLYMIVLRIVQVWSVVLTMMIGLGLLLVLLRAERSLKVLHRVGPLLSAPLAVLLQIQMVLNPYLWQPYQAPWQMVCTLTEINSPSKDPTSTGAGLQQLNIMTAEICSISGFLLFVHIYGLIRLRRLSPRCVMQRAFGATTKYLLAFFLVWSFWVFNCLFIQQLNFDPSSFWRMHCVAKAFDGIILDVLQDIFMALAGVFNLMAYHNLGQRITERVLTFEQDAIARDEERQADEAYLQAMRSFYLLAGETSWPLEDLDAVPPSPSDSQAPLAAESISLPDVRATFGGRPCEPPPPKAGISSTWTGPL